MIQGMINSFCNLFKKSATIDFPNEQMKISKNYRGLINHSDSDCIWCDVCEKVCPPGAILFLQNMDGSKKYNYNPYLCIYCGECVRNCPKPNEALWQEENIAFSSSSKKEVQDDWFSLEDECKIARVKYKEHKESLKKSQKVEQPLS
ncbi:MAG: 4Fe-4S dicluster domain-containing protein [Campylobacterales bacterium]|nr:4Fe-4S dicluster domain-containing protein [Campylobacterales bacterium]